MGERGREASWLRYSGQGMYFQFQLDAEVG